MSDDGLVTVELAWNGWNIQKFVPVFAFKHGDPRVVRVRCPRSSIKPDGMVVEEVLELGPYDPCSGSRLSREELSLRLGISIKA